MFSSINLQSRQFEMILIGVLVSVVLVQGGASPHAVSRKDSLQLIQVIFRHGDRAPTYTYPKDPYSDTKKYWPEGLAQLTNRGKMQQYELGRYLRNRYDGYLGSKYSQKELYVTSSDMDRTIMSLESNLAGLFPPVNHWNPNIEWQPIPLRTIPWKDDKYLHINVKCPRYNEIRREFYSSSTEVRRLNEENEDFIRYCAENSGLNASTVKELYPLLDVLYAQASHNFTLPSWAQGETLPKLIQLYSTVNTWSTYTTEMKRLWGGPLLNLIIKNMQAIAGHLGSTPDDAHSVSHGVNRKMLMYSAHDSTLARIMNTMGVFEPHCPPYAAALLVELHQDVESQEYFVEIYYRNDTKREAYLLKQEKCQYPCELRSFIEISQALIPSDWAHECKLDTSKPMNYFFVKMNEHDHDDHTDGNEISSGSANSSNPGHSSIPCNPSAFQLVLMGIGILGIAAAVMIFIVTLLSKIMKCQSSDSVDFGEDSSLRQDSRVRSWVSSLLKVKSSSGFSSAYEPL